mmetsp:Transcript_17132/g.30743  ORF Transcript_17132/g.30743 Transcript_17132/m.30743 type:complete len:320 (-) Transcript_17132:31-990(-)
MFLHAYQSGTHVEVFSSQNRAHFSLWHASGPVARAFDRNSRSFVLNLGATARAALPKSTKETLGLVQPYVVFQAFFPKGKLLTIEIGFTDNTGTLRRLIFTQGREIVRNQLHARIPIDAVSRDIWVNLCIDVVSFISHCFPSITMRSIDSLSVSGMCLVKRIFTMRMRLRDTTKDNDDANYYYEPVPVPCEFPRHSQCVSQYFDLEKVGGQRLVAYSTSPPKTKALSTKIKYKNIFSPPTPFPKKLLRVNSIKGDDQFKLASQESDTSLLKVNSQFPHFDNWMRQMLEVRHFTPPFVDVEDSPLRYDPIERSYKLAADV